MMSSESSKGKNGRDSKRRFNDEQVKSLESMFQTESKLEARAKVKLARELDLQPRQVAIWFQNKRARWKSKQLERDYHLLKADFDALASQFESESQEKQSLLAQLQKLHLLLETPPDQRQQEHNSNDGKCEREPKPLVKDESNPSSHGGRDGGLGKYVMEPSDTHWGSSDPFDRQLSGDSQWWELWS